MTTQAPDPLALAEELTAKRRPRNYALRILHDEILNLATIRLACERGMYVGEPERNKRLAEQAGRRIEQCEEAERILEAHRRAKEADRD